MHSLRDWKKAYKVFSVLIESSKLAFYFVALSLTFRRRSKYCKSNIWLYWFSLTLVCLIHLHSLLYHYFLFVFYKSQFKARLNNQQMWYLKNVYDLKEYSTFVGHQSIWLLQKAQIANIFDDNNSIFFIMDVMTMLHNSVKAINKHQAEVNCKKIGEIKNSAIKTEWQPQCLLQRYYWIREQTCAKITLIRVTQTWVYTNTETTFQKMGMCGTSKYEIN